MDGIPARCPAREAVPDPVKTCSLWNRRKCSRPRRHQPQQRQQLLPLRRLPHVRCLAICLPVPGKHLHIVTNACCLTRNSGGNTVFWVSPCAFWQRVALRVFSLQIMIVRQARVDFLRSCGASRPARSPAAAAGCGRGAGRTSGTAMGRAPRPERLTGAQAAACRSCAGAADGPAIAGHPRPS